jgi:hypothetical protein
MRNLIFALLQALEKFCQLYVSSNLKFDLALWYYPGVVLASLNSFRLRIIIEPQVKYNVAT